MTKSIPVTLKAKSSQNQKHTENSRKKIPDNKKEGSNTGKLIMVPVPET
jgi:hypothetical protein